MLDCLVGSIFSIQCIVGVSAMFTLKILSMENCVFGHNINLLSSFQSVEVGS